MTALTVTGLTKSFGGLRVTKGVDLAVEPGERRLIIGPNGAGKTTLFNLITGELAPDSGSILLFDRSEEHTSELQSLRHLVCRLLLEKKKKNKMNTRNCIENNYDNYRAAY